MCPLKLMFCSSYLQTRAAGPESLVNYFQKGALLGQKAALNLWYVDIPGQIRKNCSRAFEGLSNLAYTIQKKKLCLVIFFIKNKNVMKLLLYFSTLSYTKISP